VAAPPPNSTLTHVNVHSGHVKFVFPLQAALVTSLKMAITKGDFSLTGVLLKKLIVLWLHNILWNLTSIHKITILLLSLAQLIHSMPFHPIYKIHFNIILLFTPQYSFISGVPTKKLYTFLFSPMPDTFSISSSLILSHELHLVENDNYKTSHYAVFSRLLFPPHKPKCVPHHPTLNHPCLYSFLNVIHQVYIDTKQCTKLSSCIFNSCIFR